MKTRQTVLCGNLNRAQRAKVPLLNLNRAQRASHQRCAVPLLLLAVIFALTFITCDDGGNGGTDTPVTFSSVAANGSPSQTTTQLTLTFSAAITGLSAADITLSGVSGVSKGTLSGSGPTYTLPISGFTSGGTLSLVAAKTGYAVSGSPKQVTIYYYNGSSVPATPSTPQPFNDITAAQLVANIKVGWNLGNTLDAHSKESWFPSDVPGMETSWGNPITTKAMITAVKNAGFNGIRIPVSWYKASDANYNIRADWMARVVEVVNYAADNDMYILLNTHHDEDIFKFTNAGKVESLKAFNKIWEQIADTFKNYDEKLIFEALNEPRTIDSSNEWIGGTAEEHSNLNEHYQVFVDAVRASGGNNNKRILMINTYAASATQTAVDDLILPADTADNKLVVSIHAYTPYDFCSFYSNTQTPNWSSSNSSDTGAIHSAITPAYNKFVSQGVPVIIGEFGTVNKNNEDARAAWAEYYVSYAKSKNIPCFFWDNGITVDPDGEPFGIFNRSNNTFVFPKIRDALMRGIEGGGGETVVGSFSAYAGNQHIELSSSVAYQVVNLTGEGRINVMKVTNPGEWAVALYDLAAYKNTSVTITFSADVKRAGSAGSLFWQMNNSDNPFVGTPITNAAAGTWHTMSGTWTGTPTAEYPSFYLSTYQNNSDSTTYYIDNFTITVE